MPTADAVVLREANSVVRWKLARLDLGDQRFDQLAQFNALLLWDRVFQILNLMPLSRENH